MRARPARKTGLPVELKTALDTMQIAIFHNIMWSKYKGAVFSAIHELTTGSETNVAFTQIAETEGERVALGGVDLGYHRYPYELIFPGSFTGISTLRRVAALVSRAWRTQADIIVLPGYERIEYWAMLAVLLLRGKARAVFCDSTAFDRPSKTIKSIAKRLFFSLCHGFFAYGVRSRDYLMQHGVAAEAIYFRCQSAALPLDYSEGAAMARRLAIARTVSDAPSFLFVGRVAPEKGLDTLLNAFCSVVQTHPRAQLNIVGAGTMTGCLLAQAHKLGLVGNVNFLGSMGIHELAEQYAAATALVLPSTSEPWGLVVNEALSMGCPAVVSNVCGCVPELILDGKTGFVFQASNTDELAERLLASHLAFADTEHTARECIEHMRSFTPTHAAQHIIDGCHAIVKRCRAT